MATGRRTVLPLPDGSPEPLAGGFKNELLRYGDVVVRLERSTLASVEWEHRLLGSLDLPEAVVPLGGPAVWPDGRIASLLPYVSGAPVDRDDPGQRAQVARLLARLHRTAWDGTQRPGASSWVERDLAGNDWWDWEIVEKPAVLADAYEQVAAFLADPPALRTGVVHGDPARGNILVRDGAVVALLDWEEARLDWLAAELANAAWELCRGDERSTDDFVAAYVDAGGPAETDRHESMLRLRLLADVLYSLTSKARGDAYDPAYVDFLLAALA